MDKISGNILELVDSNKIFEMMNDGYSYMKREHVAGRLSTLGQTKKLQFNEPRNLLRPSLESVELVPKLQLPKAMRRVATTLGMMK